MILSDRTIREELAAGRIVIDPLDDSCIQPSSVDLRLDRLFRVFLNHTMPVIDVKENLEDLTRLVEIDEGDAFILHPGEFVLGSTFEQVALPDDLVARIEGKSSLGRLGLLIHSSLPGSEPVVVLDGDTLVARPIQEVVRKRQPARVVAFDPETLEIGYHEITGWYEGPPDRIYEVVLSSGRRVRVTAGHNVFTVGRRGELTKARTGELRAGVRIATPRKIPEPPRRYGRSTTAPEIAIVELVPDPAPRQLTVAGPTVVAAHGSRPEEVAGLLRAEGYAAASYYRRRGSLPYAVAQQVPGLLASLGPRDLVGWRGGRNAMPARIAIDSERAWLLGLYVAQGYRRAQQVVVSNNDQQILDRAGAALSDLGLTFHRDPQALTCGSSILSAVLDWLGTGGMAPTKRIPPAVFGWTVDLIEAFLAGMVDGEGSLDGGRTSVSTTSDGLVADLLLLFGRLGRRAGSCRRPDRGNALPCWQVSASNGEHKLLTSVPLPKEPLVTLRRVDSGLLWDEVVAVRDTGVVEPIFDLEVRPGGRKIENFLAGHGGVFVSNTAGFIDAGFSGHITLELSNVANLPITLYPGMKIGQVSFLRMTTPADVPYGSSKVGSKYQGQRGPTPSRYWENFRDQRQ
jgi:deoxycytidine triphosphate deaminase/intein/homing endonuclease